MSLILEALKRSEKERQQNKTATTGVPNRTLSVSAARPSRWPFWLVAGTVPITLLVGWWLVTSTNSPQEQPASPEQIAAATPAETQPSVPVVSQQPAPVETTAPVSPVVVAEPAPVPRPFPGTPPAMADRSSVILPDDVVTPLPVVAGGAANDSSDAFPLYEDLSRELRSQMPPLEMSLHFYTEAPARRLVRIDDRLLHEGDWLNRDLQLVEITPAGAILDFLGKDFLLRNHH